MSASPIKPGSPGGDDFFSSSGRSSPDPSPWGEELIDALRSDGSSPMLTSGRVTPIEGQPSSERSLAVQLFKKGAMPIDFDLHKASIDYPSNPLAYAQLKIKYYSDLEALQKINQARPKELTLADEVVDLMEFARWKPSSEETLMENVQRLLKPFNVTDKQVEKEAKFLHKGDMSAARLAMAKRALVFMKGGKEGAFQPSLEAQYQTMGYPLSVLEAVDRAFQRMIIDSEPTLIDVSQSCGGDNEVKFTVIASEGDVIIAESQECEALEGKFKTGSFANRFFELKKHEDRYGGPLFVLRLKDQHPKQVEGLRREFQMTKKLAGEGVPKVHLFLTVDGQTAMVTEAAGIFLDQIQEGEPLLDNYDQEFYEVRMSSPKDFGKITNLDRWWEGSVSQRDRYQILVQLGHALKAICRAHEMNYVHGDFKMGNIFPSKTGGKLGDWDSVLSIGKTIVEYIGEDNKLKWKYEDNDQDVNKGGTFIYLSPEVYCKSYTVDSSRDAWAFAMDLWELKWGLQTHPLFMGILRDDNFVPNCIARLVSFYNENGELDVKLTSDYESRFPKTPEVDPNKDPDGYLRYILWNCTRIRPEERIRDTDLLEMWSNYLKAIEPK